VENIFEQRKNAVKGFQNAVRSRVINDREVEIPEGLFEVCPKCDEHILSADLTNMNFVCSECSHHFRISAKVRIASLVDAETFNEMNADLISVDPLKMPGYSEKITQITTSEQKEAVVTGIGNIGGFTYAIGAMDSNFLMGSMGCAVGEKLVNLIEVATKKKLPLIIISTSGGARMQEGILSLMQMAKTTAAIKKHNDAGLLYISVLTSPTYGGVSASFATVADILIAEPAALVGFAGPRVIKQTIRQILPEGFQSAEFLLEKGQIDLIIPRNEMKQTITKISKLHGIGGAQ